MFTCDTGYQIIDGSMRRVCQEDSTWSGTDLVCALKSKSTYSKFLTKATVQSHSTWSGTDLVCALKSKICSLKGILWKQRLHQ